MIRSVLPGAVLGLCLTGTAIAQSLGTAFTYQGQLTEAGQPALGLFDLQVCVFDSPSDPLPLGCAPDFDDVPVEDGAFTITLDFGADTFNGQSRWLELRVRPGTGATGYTILSPRQLIRPAPEALRANTAETATTAVTADSASSADSAPWSGLSGIPAGFADGIDHDSGGTVTGITAGTGLTGGTITGSGTIGIADGGVGSQQLADGAVGLQQIDLDEVQARLNGSCPTGQYLSGIQANGAPICSMLPRRTESYPINSRQADDAGPWSSLAIGNDGLPAIAHYSTVGGGSLWLAKCVDAACANGARFSEIDYSPSTDDGSYVSMAIGSDGLPVMSYREEVNGWLKVAKCQDPSCSLPATITILDDTADVGRHTSIALDSSGNPVISYQDSSSDALKVVRCTNASCTGALQTVTTVDDHPSQSLGIWTSIAIGPDNLPIIVHVNSASPNLRIVKCSNFGCTTPPTITVIAHPNLAALYPDIMIGSDGLPIISYYLGGIARSPSLRVAKCTDPSCTAEPIRTIVDDSPNTVGLYTSIAVAANGLPIISYQDDSIGALKVAQCTDLSCTGPSELTVVDHPGTVVGRHTSIAIGADGLPIISHHDETTQTIRFTHCGTQDCRSSFGSATR